MKMTSALLGALAMTATAAAAPAAPLFAQGVPAAAVQLAFGYDCGDRFLIRNEGSQPVTLEWKTTGSQDRSQVHLNANESRQIASASPDAVELWVNGKLVATEPKGNRACTSAAVGTPNVIVRPLGASGAISAPAQPASGDPPSRVARISSVQGGVSLQGAGSTDWGAASLNYSVTTGDHLVSDQAGRAELELGSVAVRMAESADVTVTSLTDGLLQLGVPQGTVRLSVYRLGPSDTVEVDTPNGAVTLRAPGSYRISTDATGDQTLLSVDRGRAELSGPNLAQTIDGGHTVRMLGGGPNGIQVAEVPHPGPDGFDSWSAYRDGVLTNAASPSATYVSPDTPGLHDLDANGNWDNDAEYGPVWYPTTVAAGWVPYRFGHWAWIEPWGWVWVEDEPWGFAPFHYGRWAFMRGRWGWVPGPRAGRPYFAPALVAFADGSGFGLGIGVSAWFPLGPRDPFMPWYHHDEGYLREVNRANVRGVTDINVFVHVRDVDRFPYAYRNTAMTVVPRTTLASGRPVSRDIVRVAPDRIAQAHITPHPMVVPTREAAAGGMVVARPAIAAAPGALPGAPRVRPPSRGSVTAVPRPLVTRSPLPPAAVPFETRQKAISQHPGRPLEPQQLQNLRSGRPAGPQRDPEPPHPAPRQPDRGSARGSKKPR